MTLFHCNCRYRCALVAVGASVLAGVIAAFLHFAGVFTVTPAFLWVAFGIAIVYLGVLVVSTALARRTDTGTCVCPTLNTLLVGILGTILFSLVLLAVGVVATSVLSAILVGLLLAFFALTVTASVCLVRSFADCSGNT